mmetsp:Transcript_113171/g.365653  ORF Transcript_113171/g.365653 Transcript_113171/m.365653 type:complete len:213 (+) Transcript_113171:872-1510(+)
MFSCSVRHLPRANSWMLACSFRKRRNGGAPTAASASARRSTSSLGAMASAARLPPLSSRSCSASGMRLVRCGCSFPLKASVRTFFAARGVIWERSTGPYSKSFLLRRWSSRKMAGAASPPAATATNAESMASGASDPLPLASPPAPSTCWPLPLPPRQPARAPRSQGSQAPRSPPARLGSAPQAAAGWASDPSAGCMAAQGKQGSRDAKPVS